MQKNGKYLSLNIFRTRYGTDDIQDALANHEFTEGKKVKIVHKTGYCVIYHLENMCKDLCNSDALIEKFNKNIG